MSTFSFSTDPQFCQTFQKEHNEDNLNYLLSPNSNILTSNLKQNTINRQRNLSTTFTISPLGKTDNKRFSFSGNNLTTLSKEIINVS